MHFLLMKRCIFQLDFFFFIEMHVTVTVNKLTDFLGGGVHKHLSFFIF